MEEKFEIYQMYLKDFLIKVSNLWDTGRDVFLQNKSQKRGVFLITPHGAGVRIENTDRGEIINFDFVKFGNFIVFDKWKLFQYIESLEKNQINVFGYTEEEREKVYKKLLDIALEKKIVIEYKKGPIHGYYMPC